MFTPKSEWTPPNLSSLPSWAGQARVGIDTEFHDPSLKKLGLGARRGVKVAGYSFAFNDGTKHYIPVRHPEGNVDCEQGMRYLRDQAKSYAGELVGANIPTELDIFAYEPTGQILFPKVSFFRDVLLADPLIYELAYDGYSLNAVARRRGFDGKDEQLMREAAQAYGADISKPKTWKAIIPHLPPKYVGPYGEEDAYLPLKVLAVQDKLIDELGIRDCWNLESRLLPILLKMRQRGVRIDFDKLDQIEIKSRADEKDALDQIYHLTGVRIFPGDTMKTQACVPAFAAVGIQVPMIKDPETGKIKYNLDKEFLVSIDHPVPKLFLAARKAAKRYSTFVKSIREHSVNQRIHTTFRQIVGHNDKNEKSGAAFGRLSSVAPNAQQQPNDPEWRSIYIPEEGAKWGCLDCCFSEDTEILTKRGFIPFPSLLESDLVAQFDIATKTIDYAKPLAYHRPEFNGQMVRITSKRSIDLLVTPNHNCLLEGKQGFFTVRADEYPQRTNILQHMASVYLGGNQPVTAKELVTSVAVQADGTLRTSHYRIWISKERKIERAKELLTYTNTYQCEKKGKQTAFLVELDKVPLLLPGPDKVFNRERLAELPLEQRIEFLRELLLWDGTGKLCEGKATYATTNQANAEIVQEIASISGVKAMITEWDQPNRKRCYLVNFSKRIVSTTASIKTTREAYSGLVYCVTMPKGTVFVRRNKITAITEQSQQEPRWTTHFAAKLNLTGAREAAKAYHDDPKIDNHQFMADLTGLPRKYAKALYLGLTYGEGGAKMSHGLELPTRWCVRFKDDGRVEYFETKAKAQKARKNYEGEASYYEVAGEEGQAIIDTFNKRAPFIKELARFAEKRAKKTGKVTLFGGRIVNFPVEKDGSYGYSYKSLNRVIQGSGGMQIKQAIIDIDREMPDFFLQIQCHDELDGSFSSVKQMKDVARIMARAASETLVPWRIDIEYGNNWGYMSQVCGLDTCHDTVDKKFEVNGIKETYYCPSHAVSHAA